MRDQQRRFQMQQVARARALVQRAHDAPNTWVGGLVLPILAILVIVWGCLRCSMPEQCELAEAEVTAAVHGGRLGQSIRDVSRRLHRRGWTLADASRICVCLFFLHARSH